MTVAACPWEEAPDRRRRAGPGPAVADWRRTESRIGNSGSGGRREEERRGTWKVIVFRDYLWKLGVGTPAVLQLAGVSVA